MGPRSVLRPRKGPEMPRAQQKGAPGVQRVSWPVVFKLFMVVGADEHTLEEPATSKKEEASRKAKQNPGMSFVGPPVA